MATTVLDGDEGDCARGLAGGLLIQAGEFIVEPGEEGLF